MQVLSGAALGGRQGDGQKLEVTLQVQKGRKHRQDKSETNLTFFRDTGWQLLREKGVDRSNACRSSMPEEVCEVPEWHVCDSEEAPDGVWLCPEGTGRHI